MTKPSFTIGVEEEHLLIDANSGALAVHVDDRVFRDFSDAIGTKVTKEFFQCQVEVGTRVCQRAAEAAEDLKQLRRAIDQVARSHGLRMMACSTHPWMNWHDLKQTQNDRYDTLAEDLKIAAQRLVICGQHIHVGVEDDDLRIDLLNQMSYFLPHLLAFSTSSPFWCGQDTGLSCYRLSVFDVLPRTGLPDRFDSYGEYQRFLQSLSEIGLTSDIWWDARLSSRYPTIETRICDVSTNVDHAIAIAALNQCLLRFLWRLRAKNLRWRIYPLSLISENRWRAARYGEQGKLIDLGLAKLLPISQLLEEIFDLVDEDMNALECQSEVLALRAIVQNGSSATQQKQIYRQSISSGGDEKMALKSVVDWITEQSVTGLS